MKWDENYEISSYSDEEANMQLMASPHSDDEENMVSDYEINDISSYDKLRNAFHELHEIFLKLSRIFSK